MIEHMLEEFTEEGGWDRVACACGWMSPDCPGKEEAANFWGQHLLTIAADGLPHEPEFHVTAEEEAADG